MIIIKPPDIALINTNELCATYGLVQSTYGNLFDMIKHGDLHS